MRAGSVWKCGLVWMVITATASAQEMDLKPDRKGTDWAQFLGPTRNGVSTETGLIKKWPEQGPPVLWKKTIGTGYSAPSVKGMRVVFHHRVDDEEIVQCVHAVTGKDLWKFTYPTKYRDPYGYNNGPRCAPLLTEKVCYTFGAEGKLLCLDLATGKKIWLRDVQADFQLPDWFFGIGCSPVLEGNLLIALVGGQPNSGVVAFDATTGKTVWEKVGKETWDGVETGWTADPKYQWTGTEMIVSYSSPIVVTIHGKRHLLCLLRHGLVSLDPKTGQQRFKFWFRSRTYESVNAATPVVIGDKIFLSGAYRLGTALLQVKPDGKSFDVLWKDARNMLTHWSTAIHTNDHIYGFSARHEPDATFRCIDLTKGKLTWQTTGLAGSIDDLKQDPQTGEIIDKKTGKTVPWPFYGRGSKILVDGQFIALGERGTLSLVNVDSQKWDEVSRCSFKEIGYPAWAAPVLSRKRLLLRSEDTLLCLDLAPPKTAASQPPATP